MILEIGRPVIRLKGCVFFDYKILPRTYPFPAKLDGGRRPAELIAVLDNLLGVLFSSPLKSKRPREKK